MNTGFTQDGTQATGSVVIDSTNNSLQGMYADAINNAGLGVTASIVSDGSDKPYHLVLSSTKTGANSAMKISLSGSDGQPADSALSNLLSYDAGATQTSSRTACCAKHHVQRQRHRHHQQFEQRRYGHHRRRYLGITKIGTSSSSVAKDTTTVKTSISAFVKATMN